MGRGHVGEGSERATKREPDKRARATDWKEEKMKKRKGKRGGEIIKTPATAILECPPLR